MTSHGRILRVGDGLDGISDSNVVTYSDERIRTTNVFAFPVRSVHSGGRFERFNRSASQKRA